MRFWHISKADGMSSHKAQADYFSAACAERDIEYKRLTEEELGPLDVPDMHIDDILYRSARGVWAKTLEQIMISPTCKHLYVDWKTAITGKGSSFIHLKNAGLPVVPSIHFLPRKKRDSLAAAEYLGGFPVIIKVAGGMEGVGVMRVDSIESFNSVSDFVRKDVRAEARIMRYIPHEYFGRLVVVGGNVIASTRDFAPLGDFRANARGPRERREEHFDFGDAINDMAVRAARAVGVKCGGVDIMVGKDGVPYIAEINMPFNFADTQKITSVDIAGALIDQALAV